MAAVGGDTIDDHGGRGSVLALSLVFFGVGGDRWRKGDCDGVGAECGSCDMYIVVVLHSVGSGLRDIRARAAVPRCTGRSTSTGAGSGAHGCGALLTGA